jgi:hypothetical protein
MNVIAGGSQMRVMDDVRKFAVAHRVALVGVLVDYGDHSWQEIHPVFSEAVNGGPVQTSGTRYGGSSPSDWSFDAVEGCRRPSGARCDGYWRSASSPPASARSASGYGTRGAGSCTVSASFNFGCGGFDIYVRSNQLDRVVSVSDTAGWQTNSAGYAEVYLRVSGRPVGQRVSARVGSATCVARLS